MEDWALIRRLAAEGVPKAVIARRLGIARNTVARAVASESPPKYERNTRPTSFTPYEARVRQLLADTPDMPATVLAERVGWTGSIRWFRDNVNRVRADHRPIDPADRLTWAAGDVAQCDLWFSPRKILLEDGSRTLLPVLVMTCGYSRFMLGRMIPTRKTPDLLLGTWSLLDQLGRVPRRLIWDNEPGIGRRSVTEPVAVFAGTLASKVVLLPPRDPESKGIVEHRNRFFETSFMPGRHFASPTDFNAQFTDWLTTANARMVRTVKARPVDLVGADKDAMLPLPRRCCTWAQPRPPGPGLLRARLHVRLLGRSPRDRGPGRRVRRPGHRPGPARRAVGGRAPAPVGPPHDRDRPRPRGDRRGVAVRVPASCPTGHPG